MKWTEEKLASLQERGGYRLRGEAMTRLEVFSDAAFAFAVTMLVISLSSIPENFEELVIAIKGIPSFAASFAAMMVIWFGHRRWSQRFGLDDEISVLLTLLLVFIVLVYVYPLKLIMDLMFFGFSSSWFPMDFTVNSTKEAAGLLAFFSTGLCLVALIQLGLYLRVSSMKEDLCLSPLETLLVKKEKTIWLVQAVFGLFATLVAGIFMSSFGYLAGIFYGLIPLVIAIATMKTRKQIKALKQSSVESEPKL